MNTVLIAKALRTTFNTMQKDLLTTSYMDDDFLIQQVREMQDTYKEFKKITEDLKKNSPDDYDKLLGI
tara:strand:+ start:285 stop:488 length:204 start_codon:yes stop_codon:yes gene_type:complete